MPIRDASRPYMNSRRILEALMLECWMLFVYNFRLGFSIIYLFFRFFLFYITFTFGLSLWVTYGTKTRKNKSKRRHQDSRSRGNCHMRQVLKNFNKNVSILLPLGMNFSSLSILFTR